MWEMCRSCVTEKYLSDHPEDASQDTVVQYEKAVRELVCDFPDEGTAPELAWRLKQIRKDMFHEKSTDFTEIKKYYNNLLMSFEKQLEEQIHKVEDPLFCAMQYAMIGNYIDFAAQKNVEETMLMKLLDQAGTISLDQEVYAHLQKNVRDGGTLVYVTDNCGEIVLDKLLIREMLRINPELSVTVLVRGSSDGNDATMEDAVQIGLPSICRVMGNGAPLDATVIRFISEEARSLLNASDFILAKGQTNYESLHGCGLHTFFLFMCKCDYFTTRFQVPKYTGILTEEKPS